MITREEIKQCKDKLKELPKNSVARQFIVQLLEMMKEADKRDSKYGKEN